MMPLDMPGFPIIRTAGIDGMLVSFGDRLSEPANRSANVGISTAVYREFNIN